MCTRFVEKTLEGENGEGAGRSWRAIRPLSRADPSGGEREGKQGRKSLKFQF